MFWVCCMSFYFFSRGDFSWEGDSTKIVINLPKIYGKLQCKGEPYRFRSKARSIGTATDRHTDPVTLLQGFKNKSGSNEIARIMKNSFSVFCVGQWIVPIYLMAYIFLFTILLFTVFFFLLDAK